MEIEIQVTLKNVVFKIAFYNGTDVVSELMPFDQTSKIARLVTASLELKLALRC